MGKYGLKSGYGKFQNIQSGTVSVTVDENGDGTNGAVFKRTFKNSPQVFTQAQYDDDTVVTVPSNVTNNGFTCNVDASETTGQAVTIGYMAIDDPSTGFA